MKYFQISALLSAYNQYKSLELDESNSISILFAVWPI